MLWLTGFFSHMNSWVMACSDFTGLEVRLGFKKHLKFCKSCYPRLTLPPVAMALLNFNQRLTCVRRQSKSKFTWIFWLIRVHTHDNLWICGCSDSLTIDLTFDHQANVSSWCIFPKTYGLPMFVVSHLSRRAVFHRGRFTHDQTSLLWWIPYCRHPPEVCPRTIEVRWGFSASRLVTLLLPLSGAWRTILHGEGTPWWKAISFVLLPVGISCTPSQVDQRFAYMDEREGVLSPSAGNQAQWWLTSCQWKARITDLKSVFLIIVKGRIWERRFFSINLKGQCRLSVTCSWDEGHDH